MSTSHPDLPAVPAAPIQPALLDDRTRKTLSDARILIGAVSFLIVTVFGGGYAVAQSIRTESQETAQAAAKAETAGIRTEQASQKYALSEVREEVKDTKAEVRELKAELQGLRADLRVLFPTLPKVTKDGGQ